MQKSTLAIYAMAALGFSLVSPRNGSADPGEAGTNAVHNLAAISNGAVIPVGGGGGGGSHGGGGHGAGGYGSGYGSYGGSFYGGRNYAGRGHSIGAHSSSQSYFRGGSRQESAIGKPNGYEFSRQNVMKLASNTPLQHATLTRQNAFFNRSRFGGKEFKLGWLDHFGHRYGYRWHRSVFWPYFFGDYFSYIFWPYDYFHTFWGYGPDVILLGAFWPYGQLVYDDVGEDDSVYSGDLYYNGEVYSSNRSWKRSAETLALAETCSGFAPGVSDLPIQQLEKIIDATTDQRAALNDLKTATAKASNILKQSCSSETPLTPLSRLEAMLHRLQAMQEASNVVKAPLLHLYGLFSGAQKQRLEASTQPNASRAKDVSVGEICTEQAEFTNAPADQIASAIELTEAQKQELEKLKAVSAQASEGLKTSCPSSVPDTIHARLDAAQKRVTVLIQAIDTVRPAVRDFYASLTDEQKAALVIQSSKQIVSRR